MRHPMGQDVSRFTRDRETLVDRIGATTFEKVIGSVFYVALSGAPGGATAARVLGKPTVDGAEPCSRADWPRMHCEQISAGDFWPGRGKTTGREEADAIRLVLQDYRASCAR